MTNAPATAPRHTAVVGLQWGDEGKGKVVDILTAQHDVIVRYNGGANAGHTVIVGDERYALHLLPSGILYPEKTSVIANGVVVDPVTLLKEIDELTSRGIRIGENLRLSDRAHVVMPYHLALDEAMERALSGENAIGTTRRGIGPAYADKAYRSLAIRVGHLLDPDQLRERLKVICPIRRDQLGSLGFEDTLDVDALTEEAATLGRRLGPFITDTTYLLHDQAREGRSILFEGANATLLDIDHGTFPYVTSSNSSALGIHAGTGLPGRTVQHVLGIMKAYSTRVGAGAFPTEQDNEIGDAIRERGHEYGTTTGRPRRCGWLDLVAVRYSAMINGATGIACMLLDVLSGFQELRLCTAYRLPDGTETERFIPDAARLTGAEPIYETLPGWTEPLDDVKRYEDLPAAARAYIRRIEAVLDAPVQIVSIGPERTQTLLRF